MRVNKFVAVLSAAMMVSAPAFAMVEHTNVYDMPRKGGCETVTGADAMDMITAERASLAVTIQLEANYADGHKAKVVGTPVVVFADNSTAFKADRYTILKDGSGKFSLKKAGFLRILPAEIQTVEYPAGVNYYEVASIKVCAL